MYILYYAILLILCPLDNGQYGIQNTDAFINHNYSSLVDRYNKETR